MIFDRMKQCVVRQRTSGTPLVLLMVGTMLLLNLWGCEQSHERTWRKGNLHTHSLWSDGDNYPEMIMEWYTTHGYDFIALSDHNILARGERWIDVERSRGGRAAFQKYLDRFGAEWVEQEMRGDTLLVRLKTLAEYRSQFEAPGNFMIIRSEEISDHFQTKPIHLNATNLEQLIPPQGGTSVRQVLQNNIDAVLAQRAATGRPMIPHVNHPNFGWAITAADLAALEGEQFFEVYNGHPAVRNDGDEDHLSTERMWDVILTSRLLRGKAVMYGLAVDDAHNYHEYDSNHSNPGRGWIMVHTTALTPAALIEAMEAGQFYASTGVDLVEVTSDETHYAVRVQKENNVHYTIQFLGTRWPEESARIPPDTTESFVFDRLPDEAIGVVLKEAQGATARYTFQGDEMYVRAKVLSSKPKENPYQAGEMEVAWTQPTTFER